jgi:uncharacterized protein (TIGR03437 family)
MRVLTVALILSWTAWSAAKPAMKTGPMPFEPNRGQDSAGADFVAYGDGFALTLRAGRVDLVSRNAHLTTVLAGARNSSHGEAESPLPGVVNYLNADDPSRSITGIPTYSRVRYRAVYPGVDLVYYGNAGKLEYDFVVSPGADPRAIRLRYDGARSLQVNGDGDLMVQTAGGNLRQHRPVVYQEIDGTRREVAGNYLVRGKTVTFAVAAYDRRRALVIDPVLAWSTFVAYTSSPGYSWGEGVALDSSGNVYMIGTTVSTSGDLDALLSKLSPAGANIFTIHFGTAYDDYGHALAVDSSGNIFFGGETTDEQTFDAAWIGKINSTGSAYVFQGYPDEYALPPYYEGWDEAYGVALDANANLYVVGATGSPYFPVSSGAAQTRYAGGQSDGFVMKYNSSGTALYSTYLGGNGTDSVNAIAVDSAGDVFVTGSTTSSNFPTTSGAFQSANGGSQNAFVTKLSPSLTMVVSTYLGGNGTLDSGNAIAIDTGGAMYVTGETNSTNFPTQGAIQSSFGGGAGDLFLTKLNGNGQTLAYSTYLGGSGEDYGFGIALDAGNNVYLTGGTASTDFPLLHAFQSSNQGAVNAIVAAVDSSGGKLLFSSYLGGNGSPGSGGDYGDAVAANCAGGLVVTGATASSNFPVTSGAFVSTYPGGATADSNAFLTSIAAGPATPAISSGGVIGSWAPGAGPVAPGSLLSIYGSGFAVAENQPATLPLPTNVAGTTVNINGNPAPILYASAGQMNVQVPYEVAPGTAVVTVNNVCGVSQPVVFQVSQAAPYILQGGTGDAVAFNQDGSLNSPSNPAPAGTVIVVFLTGIGPLDNPVATGAGASGSPLSRATLPNSATIGGWNSTVDFLGLTPGTAGVAQADLTVPGLSPGAYAVVVTVGGVASNGPTIYTK